MHHCTGCIKDVGLYRRQATSGPTLTPGLVKEIIAIVKARPNSRDSFITHSSACWSYVLQAPVSERVICSVQEARCISEENIWNLVYWNYRQHFFHIWLKLWWWQGYYEVLCKVWIEIYSINEVAQYASSVMVTQFGIIYVGAILLTRAPTYILKAMPIFLSTQVSTAR